MKSGSRPHFDSLKKYPLSPEQINTLSEELLSFDISPITNTTYMTKGVLKPAVQKCVDGLKSFQAGLKAMVGSDGGKKKVKSSDINIDLLTDEFNGISVSSGPCKDIIVNNLKLSPESAAQFPKLFTPKSSYLRDYMTGSYQKKFAKDSDKVADPKVAYDVLRNPQNHYEDKYFAVQGLLHDSKDQSSHLTMGGLKSPSYYIVKDCKCDDPNLLDKVAKNGEFHQMDTMPVKDEVASSGDACIVSLPVPTSCMVEITNADDGSKEKDEDPSIKWLDADGADVSTVLQSGLGDLNLKINELNSNFDFDKSCPPGDAVAKAEAVVKSLGCGENDDIKLPHPEDEFADCKE